MAISSPSMTGGQFVSGIVPQTTTPGKPKGGEALSDLNKKGEVAAQRKPPVFTKSIVMICTNAASLKVGRRKRKTGVWLEELATPYYTFLENGIQPIIATPRGGAIPIDSGSLAPGFFSKSAKKFLHDRDAMDQLSHSIKLQRLVSNCSADGVFICGGHGTCEDVYAHEDVKSLVEEFDTKNKIVGAVCHGVMALCECLRGDGTGPLVEGRRVTGFTDSEEVSVGLQEIVPYLTESRLKQLGAKFLRAGDWMGNVVVDGNLITGQNPQSSEEIAAEMVKAIFYGKGIEYA